MSYERTIQKTGGGTFLVSLPKEWIKKHDLSQKDPVLMRETQNGSILISPSQIKSVEKRKIISDSRRLERDLFTYYLAGYDIIEIKSSGYMEKQELIKELVQRFFGLEIVGEEKDSVEVHFLISSSKLDPHTYVKRTFSIATSMLRDSITSYLSGDDSVASSVVQRDNEVNRLYFFIVRILREIVQGTSVDVPISPIECLDLRMVASLIEELGDRAVGVAQQQIDGVISLEKDLNDEERNLIETCIEHSLDSLQKSMKAFLEHNVDLAESSKTMAVEKAPRTLESLSSLREKGILIDPLVSTLRRVLEITADIADLALSESNDEED